MSITNSFPIHQKQRGLRGYAPLDLKTFWISWKSFIIVAEQSPDEILHNHYKVMCSAWDKFSSGTQQYWNRSRRLAQVFFVRSLTCERSLGDRTKNEHSRRGGESTYLYFYTNRWQGVIERVVTASLLHS